MDTNYRVLAFDPGGTTGWAMYDGLFLPDLDGDKPRLVEQRHTVGHLGPHEHHDELYEFLEESAIHNFAVVWESFEFRQGKQRDNLNLISKEYIGVLKLFVKQRHCRAKSYTAGASKGFVPDKGPQANQKLKVMNWYTPGWKHANDASRVLIKYLVDVERRFDLIESWRGLT